MCGHIIVMLSIQHNLKLIDKYNCIKRKVVYKMIKTHFHQLINELMFLIKGSVFGITLCTPIRQPFWITAPEMLHVTHFICIKGI